MTGLQRFRAVGNLTIWPPPPAGESAADRWAIGGTRSRRIALLAVGLFAAVLGLGAVEDWYGRTDYAQDAISYLSVAHAIEHREWVTALNPQWSIGYPALIAMVRPLFPAGAGGEWNAVHTLNLAIFAATYLAFLFAVRQAWLLGKGEEGSRPDLRWMFLLLGATAVFVATELGIDAASRVGPDLLVSCLVFASLGLMLKLLAKPARKARGFLQGALLGFGYWTKVAFLPFSAAQAGTLALALRRRKVGFGCLARMAAAMLILSIPYSLALSWALGRFTLGESASLNYEFHVNRIPRFTHWQGGPAGFGVPIHPTRKLLENPPLFEFGEPFHTTYPPFNNIVYWYEGYRRFFSLRLQAMAILRGCYQLLDLLRRQPMAYFSIFGALWLGLRWKRRAEWKARALDCWPFYLPAAAGLCQYLLVHVEGRYIASYLAVLGVLPLVALARCDEAQTRRLRRVFLAAASVAAVASFGLASHAAVARFVRGASYRDDPQWRLAEFLAGAGLKPGDRVASIDWIPASRCTWAEADGLRIVAEIGNDAYDHDHPERNLPLFWQSSAAVKQKVYRLFRQSGAVAVIAAGKPERADASGWRPAGTSGEWFYSLR